MSEGGAAAPRSRLSITPLRGRRWSVRWKQSAARQKALEPDQAIAWHHLSAEDATQRLETSAAGLTSTEAAERLARYGRNQIVRQKPVSPLRLLARQFRNFFVLVLLFAAAPAYTVSLMPGEAGRRLTAFFILGIVALSVALSFFQEYRAQKELEAIGRLLVVKAVVVRDGLRRQIDAADVVPGDILVLSLGQKVPADARVIEAHGLQADESALTGESIGADKAPEPVALDAALAERSSMVFGSTFITHGAGLAVAVRAGMSTEVGHIAASLQQMAERPTPFQVEVQKMARQMTAIVGVLAVVVAALLYFALHQPPVDIAVNTLSLAVATIPESLPIVLTFALALGARHMAARRAVVRRLSAVESLGSVDTICTDKTGTLTQNAMAVQRLFVDGQLLPVPRGEVDDKGITELLRAGMLCSEATDGGGPDGEILGDPVDTALLRAVQLAGLDVARERASYPTVSEIPFSSERKMMTTVHRHEGALLAYAKGAPGTILAHCTYCWHHGQHLPLGDDQCHGVDEAVKRLQREGMYVLGLACKEIPSGPVDDEVEQGMTFLGLQALIDPPRPEAAQAVVQARAAGIRVVMITGDNALTARVRVGHHGPCRDASVFAGNEHEHVSIR